MAVKNNTLNDLNNALFETLDRLQDAESDEELQKEIDRAKAITAVSSQIVNNAKLALDAEKFATDFGRKNVKLPTMLGGGSDDNK